MDLKKSKDGYIGRQAGGEGREKLCDYIILSKLKETRKGKVYKGRNLQWFGREESYPGELRWMS